MRTTFCGTTGLRDDWMTGRLDYGTTGRRDCGLAQRQHGKAVCSSCRPVVRWSCSPSQAPGRSRPDAAACISRVAPLRARAPPPPRACELPPPRNANTSARSDSRSGPSSGQAGPAIPCAGISVSGRRAASPACASKRTRPARPDGKREYFPSRRYGLRAGVHLPAGFGKSPLHLRQGRIRRGCARDHQQIAARGNAVLLMAKYFPEPALRAIALHGATHGVRRGDHTHAGGIGRSAGAWFPPNGECPAVHAPALLAYDADFAWTA